MSISFKFTVVDSLEGAPEGWELGDMEVRGSEGEVSSKGNSEYLMMVFSAAGDLPSQFQMFQNSKRRSFEFNGIDGSFIIRFERLGKGQFSVKDRKGHLIGHTSGRELFVAMLQSIDDLINQYGQPTDEAVIHDLKLAIERCKQEINKIR